MYSHALDGVLIRLTWISRKFVRYQFVLLGEERHCKGNRQEQTKALTHTVDSEFNGLSIQLSLSSFLVDSNIPSSTKFTERGQPIQGPAGTNLWWNRSNMISLSLSNWPSSMFESQSSFVKSCFSITFITLESPGLISSVSCQDKIFHYQSPTRSLSIAVQRCLRGRRAC